MKYTRSLTTMFCALCVMLVVSLVSSLGQKLGWCQEREYTPEELACIDSGLAPDCSMPEGGPGNDGVQEGSPYGMQGRGNVNPAHRTPRKEPARGRARCWLPPFAAWAHCSGC